ncbi:MAG: right-handed parallel beta-helix repeat-containing protein [Verrucomicrobia bacterium]|nr:right-handed parallel beta-helix repeat-containing protein [Verrucomicrobiota bacterium]MCH8526180.1 right-handed parallel beta-helix repeat-containing protein [Kiritimatiellia bacterium]
MKTSLLLLPALILSACAPAPRETSPTVPSPDSARTDPARTETAPATLPRANFDSGFSPVTALAELDESRVQTVIHVRAGVRGGSGTAEAPFGSVTAAAPRLLALLGAGTPVKLQIGPGVYREDLSGFLRLKESTETVQNTPLILEGDPEGGTVFSGSVPFEAEWRPAQNDETLWSAEWPHAWEPDPGPWVATFGHPEIRDETARREALSVNGEMMRLRAIEKWAWHQPGGAPGADAGGRPLGRVNPGYMRFEGFVTDSVSDFLREPGDFTVITHPDAPEALRGRIFVRRAPGEGPPENVEIPLMRHRDAPLMRIAFKNNLVLRNLTFTHANSGYLSAALLIADSANVLIEDVRFIENVNTGLSMQRSEQVILRRVSALRNGQKGIGIGSTRDLLLEDSETSYNNVRGHWTDFRRWDPAGIKLGNVHRVEFRRHTAIGNYGGGVWWDVYCTDMLVDRSLLYGNGRLGVEMELAAPNGGNWEIRNSIVARNTGAGVFISMAANTRVLNNVIAHNGGGELEAEISRGQIVFKVRKHQVKGPRSAAEWELVTLRDNLMYAEEGQHFITFLRRNIEPAEQIPFVLDVLDADHNRYVSDIPEAGFHLIDLSRGDLNQWRATIAVRRPDTPQEMNSVRESGPAPDLAALAEILGTPWDAEKINAWHTLRDSGHFALDQFGL